MAGKGTYKAWLLECDKCEHEKWEMCWEADRPVHCHCGGYYRDAWTHKPIINSASQLAADLEELNAQV